MNKLVSGLFISLIVLFAGWFALSQRHRIFDALLLEKSSQDIQQASTVSVKKKPVHQKKIKTQAKKVNKPAPRFPQATGKTIAQKMPASSEGLRSRPGVAVQQSPQRSGTIKKQTPFIRKRPIKKITTGSQPVQPSGSGRTTLREPTKQRSTGTPAPGKIAGGPHARFDALSKINDSKLKLQAIAWSDDTARRMAVINNHVVREGQTVDGFSITNIRQDDVIVNDGTTSWRLEFSLKQ